jgi:hypothetical protein
MANEKTIDIEELRQDEHNFNKGTKQGAELMERSFREHGAGRSILLDKHGNIIAGNKSQQAAIAAGITKVRVIETTGDELVAVKRTDVDINTKEGREMALLDNLTTQVNLNWDDAELADAAEQYDIDMNEWDMATPDVSDEQPTTEAADVKELKLVFTPEQYTFVLSELRKYGDDFTHSLLQILNIYE